MKIRRILATAVAAAVTTPVVFLSAAPAFADTKPTPASTQKPATDEEDEKPSVEELEKAVAKAKAKIAALEAERDGYEKKIDAKDVGEAVATELAEATKVLDAAKAAKADADAKLAKAEEALKKLLETPAEGAEPPTDQQKADAEKAVADAKKVVESADGAKAAAQLRHDAADEAYDDAMVELFRQLSRIDTQLRAAKQELADAEEALEGLEELPEDCEEDNSIKVALSGPKTVTAGKSAYFSLRVSNTSARTLEGVEAYVDAVRLPAPGELIDDETDFAKRIIPVEWSSADNLEWTSFTEEFDSIEVGKLVKGGHYDVKLRLTVAADAPAGKGVAFSVGAYDDNNGECGIGEQFAQTEFDILAAKSDKPQPKPTPSETTATPTPAPTSGGNSNTTQQGGSSNTPVKGNLAATGANENLTQLGLAAAATVALGAGALVIARRRKAGTNA
ncbi:hypothetical protein ACHGLA_21470 [Streptomyces sp. YH02]|uniref:hypothetical protein n=1 Tax=Streptomyces sp. YH02 TaxID=3256999 RepID=UPI00375731CB